MLTWAYAFLIIRIHEKGTEYNGIHLIAAIVGDVSIVYYIARIFVGKL